MKKMLCILLFAIMLFGLAACDSSSAPAEPVNSPANTPALLSYSVYVPNNNADGFNVITAAAENISADTILNELKSQKVLPDTVSINSFAIDSSVITIDFNKAFADTVCSMGTSGELMIVGSVVNTFLDAFQAESVYFTVDGQILESGHTIYDFNLTFFSLEPQAAN